MSRADRWKSEAQYNADALARRDAAYGSQNRTSAGMAFDFRRRAPRDLRDATSMVIRAYRDEIPTKLHEGQALADDGTPKMTSRADAYIFGGDTWTDAGRSSKCECGKPMRDIRGIELAVHDPACPALGNGIEAHFYTPFKARLDEMEHHSSESVRKHAAIVKHVTIGGQSPDEAAAREGVPSWCTRTVAFDAIMRFLSGLSDVKVSEVAA